MLLLVCLCLSGSAGLFAQAAAGSGQGTLMYVTVKTAGLKDSTGFFSKTLGVLELGEAVTVLRAEGKWLEVRSAGNPPLTGWMAASSLSSKRVTSSGRQATSGELALAGKGFSAELETAYRQDARIDYAAIDRMESFAVSPEALSRFLREGRLAGGE